jgi:hypothetical protein
LPPRRLKAARLTQDQREDFTRDRNPADGERFQLRALQIRLRSDGVKLKLVPGRK